jgi:hypothetical protein
MREWTHGITYATYLDVVGEQLKVEQARIIKVVIDDLAGGIEIIVHGQDSAPR